MKAKWFITLLILSMLVIAVAPAAGAAPRASSGIDEDPTYVRKADNLPDPLTTQQLELKEKALEAKLNGKAYGKTHEVARGQYVELIREGEGVLWTVVGEFNDLDHNTMPEPDRTVDNTTIWVPDFNRDYYMNMLFNEAPGAVSMRNYYIEQSSNRYTVHGDVTEWVEVPGDAWTYDDDISGPAVWQFLIDSVDAWYQTQIDAGQTPAQINAYLSQFDVWDRYDYDGDGNFDEPDGYIDTFQSVHAGPGNEACVGTCDWAIWSHSWYAHYELIGLDGPPFNPLGGIQIGESDYWVGKYTIQPENGGVGVFAHEYGHDLGLPDLYDYYGENGTGFWTLMSSGSWMDEGKDTIGNKPTHMGAWEKFQLGWLNYEVAYASKYSTHRLGPMEFNTKQAQGLFVILPKKGVVSNIGAPYSGSYYYYSSAGDKLNNFMYKSINLPAGATLNAKVKYNTELDWDYAYLVVSTDGGATWTGLQTNLSTITNPHGQNYGYGITGSSANNWVDLTADLSAYTGNVLLGFRYWTDANTGGFGFMIDDINITGFPTDGAETDAGWTYAPTTGFHPTNGTETKWYNNYYVAEYRTYKGYDMGLKVGPYYFGYLNDPALGDFVDHFSYQDGLLINFWDTSQPNNNTGLHPGHGLLLPIDAHPQALLRCGGPTIWRNRIQTYDSTFTLTPTDGIPNIHHLGVLCPVPRLPAARVFDSRNLYYDPANPLGSVIHPILPLTIRILSISAQNSFMQIEVRPVK